MNTMYPERRRALRPRAWLLSVLLTLPLLTSCGGGGSQSNTPPPPVDDTRGGTQTAPAPRSPQAKKGLSGGQKVAITLAGAAALYYLYNKHKNAKAKQGPEGQYYLSKNGRVYYRDAQNRAHYVTPPSGGIQVPASEAQQYRDFQGYDNRPTGRDLAGVGAE